MQLITLKKPIAVLDTQAHTRMIEAFMCEDRGVSEWVGESMTRYNDVIEGVSGGDCIDIRKCRIDVKWGEIRGTVKV